MKISVLTLFPEYFEPLMTTSILKRAKEKDLFEFETIDFRQFTKEKHGHVDDTPYGGGAGRVWRHGGHCDHGGCAGRAGRGNLRRA